MRRSCLFLPGNQPNILQNGMVLPCDVLIFDLEDAVSEKEKDAARELISQALTTLDFGVREKVVRINDMETFHARLDIINVTKAGADALMVPKTVGSDTVQKAASILDEAEEKAGLPLGSVGLILLIETAMGIEKAFEAASASSRVRALALGGEDLAADLGCSRTKASRELFYARTRLVMAGRACGLDVIDTPFTDARDAEGCYEDASYARSLGFSGKLAISPHHLEPIHRAFRPSESEVAYALDVVSAMRRAKEEGLGAVSLRGKMIDLPVLAQAERTLELATASGMLSTSRSTSTKGD